MEQFFLKLPVQVNEELIEEQLISISFISRMSPCPHQDNDNGYSKIEFKDGRDTCIVKMPFEALSELIRKKLSSKNLFPTL